jgi:hypothetical protein
MDVTYDIIVSLFGSCLCLLFVGLIVWSIPRRVERWSRELRRWHQIQAPGKVKQD